ncbi:transposase family protein [Streptomyces sp. M10(2022)]
MRSSLASASGSDVSFQVRVRWKETWCRRRVWPSRVRPIPWAAAPGRHRLRRRRPRRSRAVPQTPDLPQNLDINNRTYNRALCHLRCRGERAMARLKGRWRTLRHITLSHSRIGAITQAALALGVAWRS